MATKRRRILWALPLLLLAAVLWAGAQARRINNEAEILAATGTDAIKMLKAYAEGIQHKDVESLLEHYAQDYSNPAQGFWEQVTRNERDGVRLSDWRSGTPREFSKAEIEEQLQQFLASFTTLEMAKLKLTAVEEIRPEEGTAVLRSVLWVRGQDLESRTFETQATLRFWVQRHGETLLIHRQELLSGETVSGDRRGFSEIARASGIDFVAQQNPLFSTPEWTPEKFGILRYGPAGVSAADYDGDGWDDLFFADGRAPRLYRNLGGSQSSPLRFEDVTVQVGLPQEEFGVNIGLFVDFDNDGDLDLFESRFMAGGLLYRNDGPGADGYTVFTDVSASANLGRGFVTVAAAADYDLDGDVDLYLGRYLDPRKELPTTLFYTRNGQGNSLLRNDGDLTFTDVTASAGVREGGLTLGVAWGDYDRDGDPDLYVANDFGRNALLRNEGKGEDGIVRFSDVSQEAGALDFGFGMSASWGDPDNDGDLDIYVSNVHSGQRWYGQAITLYHYLFNSVRQGTIGQDLATFREIYRYAGADWSDYGDSMVNGNSLLINDGAGHFTEVPEATRTNPFGWYWGSTFLDYDNDGRQDLYAANGWISGRTYDDL